MFISPFYVLVSRGAYQPLPNECYTVVGHTPNVCFRLTYHAEKYRFIG